jgi:hypothetical protein
VLILLIGGQGRNRTNLYPIEFMSFNEHAGISLAPIVAPRSATLAFALAPQTTRRSTVLLDLVRSR